MDGGLEDGRGALRHPLFWAALALLMLNDHVLKGAGLFPSALTGKLSDFAGLIVAPIFVAALLRARTTRVRLLSFAIATVPFIAINVSTEAARGMESLVAIVGIDWQIWTDPSDLVGLAALPVAWWLLDARPLSLPRRRAVEGVALGLAAFACMATSEPVPPGDGGFIVTEIPPPDWQTSAVLHNGSTLDVDVRLRWVSARFDCERVRQNPALYLGPDAFGAGVTVTLDSFRNFPLDRDVAGEALETGTEWLPPRTGCDAVLVQRDGSEDAVIFFDGPRRQTPRHSPSRESHAVEVGGTDDVVGGDGTTVILSFPSDRPFVAPESCPAADQPPFAYSGERVNAGTTATVTGTELLRDGCFEVSFESEAEAWSSFLCLPMWAFDLSVGDQVVFESANDAAFFLTRLATPERPQSELRLITSRTGYLGEDVDVLPPVSSDLCLGGLSACGAFVSPAMVWVGGALEVEGGETSLHAGEEASGRLYDGRAFRMALGSALETVVGVEGCAGVEREPGLEMNAVILIEEVE